MMDQIRLAELRKEYQRASLDIPETPDTPFLLFERWFLEASVSELPEPNAMTLATVDAEGNPHARVVLLKGFDALEGFVFYTNYDSAKGRQIADNSRVALCMVWLELERQVRIEGVACRVSEERSDEYFRTRPRGSQIGAWVSPQSHVLASRAELEARQAELEAFFADTEAIPRPPHWGGYAVMPHYIEFWQGRRSRLHDRIAYQLDPRSGGWQRSRLAP